MARKPGEIFPSDEIRKKVKPHVRVHLSIQNHPRTVSMYEDNDMLATWLRLMVLASDRGAAHTGDWIALNRTDLQAVSGRRRADVALTFVERLADVLGWLRERRGNVIAIQIRNFAKKQNITPRACGATPLDPAPSTTTTTTPEKNNPPTSSDEKTQKTTEGVSDESLTLAMPLASPLPNGSGKQPKPKPEVTVSEIVEAWRSVCVSRGAPDVLEVTNSREVKLRARIREHPTFDWWDSLFSRLGRSTFLFGKNDRGWIMDFDWLVDNDRNVIKVLEGKYDAKRQQVRPSGR